MALRTRTRKINKATTPNVLSTNPLPVSQANFNSLMRTILSSLLALWALAATLAFAFHPEEPACNISLEKMNVFYIGLDNPVSILVRGVPEADVRLETSDNLSVEHQNGLLYVVRGSTPGNGTITVSGGKLQPVTFNYQVRRIPDPVPRLGAQYISGTIGHSVFKAQRGMAAAVEGFDICSNCSISGYKVLQIRNNQVIAEVINAGARYELGTQSLIDDAEPGDMYIFEEIKARCPGDKAPRTLDNQTYLIR